MVPLVIHNENLSQGERNLLRVIYAVATPRRGPPARQILVIKANVDGRGTWWVHGVGSILQVGRLKSASWEAQICKLSASVLQGT